MPSSEEESQVEVSTSIVNGPQHQNDVRRESFSSITNKSKNSLDPDYARRVKDEVWKNDDDDNVVKPRLERHGEAGPCDLVLVQPHNDDDDPPRSPNNLYDEAILSKAIQDGNVPDSAMRGAQNPLFDVETPIPTVSAYTVGGYCYDPCCSERGGDDTYTTVPEMTTLMRSASVVSFTATPSQTYALNQPAAEIPIARAASLGGSFTGYTSRTTSVNYNVSSVLDRMQVKDLRKQGFPVGLANELGKTRATFPIRFWVVDNSGSMQTSDGRQLRGNKRKPKVVQCTRWKELQTAVCYHASLAGSLCATTVFRFLNEPPATQGPQEFTVAELASASIYDDVKKAGAIMEAIEPKGLSPLTSHVHEIRNRVLDVEDTLKENGQKAVVVLATDGLPSDEKGESPEEVMQEFVKALRTLQDLPVWLVVRLCTDSVEVVDFYNNLDQMLEWPLDVIDDHISEAEQVCSCNRWLNYASPLHRCREMGYHHRIFDLLDERELNKDELLSFLVLLFGHDALQDAPHPHADWYGFVKALKRVVHKEGMQWNPYTRKNGYWIDFKRLEQAYGPPASWRCWVGDILGLNCY